MLQELFSSLGGDGSFPYIFFGVFIVYFIFDRIFIRDLVKVVVDREKNTSALDDKIKTLTEKSKNLEAEYQEKVNSAISENNKYLSSYKKDLTAQMEGQLRETQDRIEMEFQKRYANLKNDFNEVKKDLSKNIDGLSELLLTKVKE